MFDNSLFYYFCHFPNVVFFFFLLNFLVFAFFFFFFFSKLTWAMPIEASVLRETLVDVGRIVT